MTAFREHLENLEGADDLLTIDERVHWEDEAAIVASEALRHNCEALRLTSTPGTVDLASGVYAGPDQITSRHNLPWGRIAESLGVGRDHPYVDLLDMLSKRDTRPSADRIIVEPAAEPCDATDLYSLGLPTDDETGKQQVTLGLIAVEHEGTTTWAPVRGTARRSFRLRLSTPQRFLDWCGEEREASVVLGVSAASLIAALQGWTQDRTLTDVPGRASALGDVPTAEVDGRVVPASAEVRIDGTIRSADESAGEIRTMWEHGCETATITFEADSLALRDDPVVPFAPLGAPLTDDIHLSSLVEAATLYRRVNGYWGVSPVSWVQLPVESRLGVCLVSSEILYAGFDWQLANALFSFSEFFDKVLVLDDYAEPTNLARALDDMWVKAHPGNDWIFSDSNAPAATAPMYRRGGETGSRLYISAIWDPRWDEDYIAPRITFESSFPENVREMARDRWSEFGSEEEER